MHDQIDPIERAFEELLVGPELQRIRHDTICVGEHAIGRNDDVAFNTQDDGRYSEMVCTTLESGRVLTVGSFILLVTSSSYLARVCTAALALT